MRIKSEMTNGRMRKRLVHSRRDPITKSPYPEHIAYVEGWPEEDIEKLKDLYGEYNEELKKAKSKTDTKWFVQNAADKAGRLFEEMAKFKRNMAIRLKDVRAKTDRRRRGVEKGMPLGPTREDPVKSFIIEASRINRRAFRFPQIIPLETWSYNELDWFVENSQNIESLRRKAIRLMKRFEQDESPAV